MNELNSAQPADAQPLQDTGYRERAEPQTRAQYAETMRRADEPGDHDLPTAEEGRQALARYEQARGQLAEPRTRQEVARADSDNQTERADVASQYPAEYLPSTDSLPQIDGPHQSSETWIDDVNPGGLRAPGRNNNCGECSRAVDSTWAGEPAVAAALADPDSTGEPNDRMTDWAGTPSVRTSIGDIGQRLSELGPGSSAVIGCEWISGSGHWFNAINEEGVVKAVDGQTGKIETWPPSNSGLGFDESLIRRSDAFFFTADGKTIEA